MSDTVIFRKFGISEAGNVIEIVTRHDQPQERRLVQRIQGMDRRARKRAARAWIDEHTNQPRVYATFHMMWMGKGTISKIAIPPIKIRITEDEDET